MLHFLTCLLIGLFIVVPAFAAPKIVTSFSILGDITKQIAGDAAQVDNLVGPNQDLHEFRPTPADVRKIEQADLVIVNGLGAEGWLDRLIASSGFKGKIIVASKGITPLKFEQAVWGEEGNKKHESGQEHHNHDALDPHAWQSVANARMYAKNIAAAVTELVPGKAAAILQRATAYDQALATLDQNIKDAIKKVPVGRRYVVTNHDAFAYFGKEYGIIFLSVLGLSTQETIMPTALALLKDHIKQHQVKAIFLENSSNNKMLQALIEDMKLTTGSTLYADALTSADGAAPNYLAMMRHNSSEIIGQLTLPLPH